MLKSDSIRIAITGPESTGKSTLTEYLAGRFGGVFVPEYAREYIDQLSRDYCYEDILKIAQTQMQLEDAAAENSNIVFCDTELLVTKIWCDDKFGKCHDWILEELKKKKYGLVLLCNTDLPWEPDPQREDPDRREYLMGLYAEQTKLFYSNIIVVTGIGEERLQMAYDAVNKMIKQYSKL
ncbi:hypothetical protein SDC9_45382 [bioreactor metagenome]|uniref:NadR/Ttd14 AAA domain-containing protein n=1 Tax=bioreactor metagenome TaxID=1076179 RepID=A0A644W6M7_9ZZZZ